MRINTILSLLLVACVCTASAVFRDWPHPGFDPQHSNDQTATGLEVSLCGIAQNRNPFSTTSTQTVVLEGVQYYSKSGTASIFAYNLTVQATGWRVPDLVTLAFNDTHNTGANLTSPIFVAIVKDVGEHFLFTYFTVGVNASTTKKVAAILDVKTGNLHTPAAIADAPSNYRALGLTIHYDLSLALLTATSSLAALPLPFNNATFEDGWTFTEKWSRALNASDHEISTPLVLNNSKVVFLYPDDTLSVIKASNGENEVEISNFGEGKKLLFAQDTWVALSNETGGVVVDTSSKAFNTLTATWPLAVAGASQFVALREEKHGNTTVNSLVKLFLNGTQVWSNRVNFTGPAAASVDTMGIVYAVGSGGKYPFVAYSLADGKFLWQLALATNSTYLASPIIASSSENDTFVLVDSEMGQVSFSPSCSGKCTDGIDCYCEPANHTYGPSCTAFCTREDTCNGHGSCNPYDGSCMCDNNYFLTDCSVRCKPDLDCFNGTCQGDGTCSCLPEYFSMKCNQYCNPNVTCNSAGTCDVDGNCSCPIGGWFETPIRVPPYCALGANYAMIGIIIAIIGLGGMCIGLCLCCFCEKSKKEAPKNPAKLGLLKHKH